MLRQVQLRGDVLAARFPVSARTIGLQMAINIASIKAVESRTPMKLKVISKSSVTVRLDMVIDGRR